MATTWATRRRRQRGKGGRKRRGLLIGDRVGRRRIGVDATHEVTATGGDVQPRCAGSGAGLGRQRSAAVGKIATAGETWDVTTSHSDDPPDTPPVTAPAAIIDNDDDLDGTVSELSDDDGGIDKGLSSPTTGDQPPVGSIAKDGHDQEYKNC
uniref:DUF834 domain-containing protein n=1 Tax=Oryza brachyantha TaxID=4533 RepID=J3MFQ7_ORYBR